MTFSVMLVTEDQRRVIGTLWAENEINAQALAPALCHCNDGERVSVCQTESREIPFRLIEVQRMQFC